MIRTTRKGLKNISALFLIFGGLILFIKGYFLLKEANQILNNIEIISAVMAAAFIIGMIKSRYVMMRFNKKNIERINNLENPQIYQFFEPRFFFFLALMIIAGISFSASASGNYNLLLIVGGIDLALSTALLKSIVVFIQDIK